MEKYLSGSYLVLLSLILFGACACNTIPSVLQKETETIKPLWSTTLPGRAGVYNDGLIGLPVYRNKILFHSTYFTNLYNEDNRIHALNIETGKLEWTFPETYDNKNPMFFWGTPYMYDDKLVVKMPKFGNLSKNDRIICLNLNTQQLLWTVDVPENISYACCRDVAGSSETFYYMQESENSAYIFGGNVMTGNVDSICSLHPVTQNGRVEITTNNALLGEIDGKLLMFFASKLLNDKNIKEKYDCFFNIFDVKKRKLLSRISVSNDENYVVSNAKLYDNKIYCTSGRKVFCIDPVIGKLLWKFNSSEPVNYTAQSLLVQNEVVFLWGDNRFIGLDATSGLLKYKGDIECGNAEAFGGQVYVISRDGNLYLLNIENGKPICKIKCPDKCFLTGCKPKVFEDKLFVFDDHHAYCFNAFSK